MNRSTKERGFVLVVALVMLAMMTLFAVTAINETAVDLKIVGNMQAQMRVDEAAQQAIEEKLSSSAAFETPISSSGTYSGQTVSVTQPDCLRESPASGYSALWSIAPQDTEWAISATAIDSVTGAQVTIKQGVKILMTSGSCP
ncbi:MAG: hypothetical protein RNU03_05045 [Candidatus Sedimenticola sp. (ex Thyasira tokunagai)]